MLRNGEPGAYAPELSPADDEGAAAAAAAAAAAFCAATCWAKVMRVARLALRAAASLARLTRAVSSLRDSDRLSTAASFE